VILDLILGLILLYQEITDQLFGSFLGTKPIECDFLIATEVGPCAPTNQAGTSKALLRTQKPLAHGFSFHLSHCTSGHHDPHNPLIRCAFYPLHHLSTITSQVSGQSNTIKNDPCEHFFSDWLDRIPALELGSPSKFLFPVLLLPSGGKDHTMAAIAIWEEPSELLSPPDEHAAGYC
jgi:hypothetical protein